MTVRQSSSTSRWKTTPRLSGGPVTRSPWISTSPAVTGSRPETHFRSVLLPQPLGPTTLTNSPERTSRSMPLSASTSPRLDLKILPTPRHVT